MRSLLAAGAAIAMSMSGVVATDCSSPSSEKITGNTYCASVDKITYQGVGGTGSYNKITNMDPKSGSCSSVPFSYSGSLAPLNEEVCSPSGALFLRAVTELARFRSRSTSEDL